MLMIIVLSTCGLSYSGLFTSDTNKLMSACTLTEG